VPAEQILCLYGRPLAPARCSNFRTNRRQNSTKQASSESHPLARHAERTSVDICFGPKRLEGRAGENYVVPPLGDGAERWNTSEDSWGIPLSTTYRTVSTLAAETRRYNGIRLEGCHHAKAAVEAIRPIAKRRSLHQHERAKAQMGARPKGGKYADARARRGRREGAGATLREGRALNPTRPPIPVRWCVSKSGDSSC